MPSRTPLSLLAQAGEKGLTVRLGETAVSDACHDYAMDVRMPFILESLV
jgi:hypothetical protein